MTQLTQSFLYATVGLAAGLASQAAFRRMPDAWLLDYDQDTAPAGFASRRAFPLLPQGLLLTALVALLYARIPATLQSGWHQAAAMLAVPLLLLVLVADWKTRIIPDQLTLALLVPGLLQAIGGWLAGQSLARAFGLPLVAALAAGGALLGIGLFGQWLLHRDAMGMGDVKMIAATAFMIGWDRLLQLVMLSFLTAAVIAVPLLIRIRLSGRGAADSAAQGSGFAGSPDGGSSEDSAEGLSKGLSEGLSEDLSESMSEDLSEDPSAIAFGPFIAIAALLLCLFPAQVDQLAGAYWSLFLR